MTLDKEKLIITKYNNTIIEEVRNKNYELWDKNLPNFTPMKYPILQHQLNTYKALSKSYTQKIS